MGHGIRPVGGWGKYGRVQCVPNFPRDPVRVTDKRYSIKPQIGAVTGPLAMQFTLLAMEIWERLCNEDMCWDDAESIVELFVKHGIAERFPITDENERDEHGDYGHRLKLEAATVRARIRDVTGE